MTSDDKRGAPMRLLPTILCLAAVATPFALAACGSSSSTTTSTTAIAAAAGGGNRRTQIANCLKKQGIALPGRFGNGGRPPSGAGGGGAGPGGGLFGGGGGARFGGANGAKFQAALQKCGLRAFRRPGGPRFGSPAAKAALNKFAACVRRNGYNLPAPNTSGNGPVFNGTKINRNDPKLLAAARKCQSLLPRFNRPPGPAGGTVTGQNG